MVLDGLSASFSFTYLVHPHPLPEHQHDGPISTSDIQISGPRMQRRLWTERNILVGLNHPFIARLQFTFQTKSNCFLGFDLYNGKHPKLAGGASERVFRRDLMRIFESVTQEQGPLFLAWKQGAGVSNQLL